MWITEKDPANPGELLRPVNLDWVLYLTLGVDGKKSYIQFSFPENQNTNWLRWLFENEKDRDNYFAKILERFPDIKLGVGDISL